MKRGRSTGAPTIAQKKRFEQIHEHGCIIARILGLEKIPAEIHHLTIGGKHGAKRLGHDFTIGINSWSHRGETIYGWSAAECLARLGPSYAKQPRAFRERFGNDDYLLQFQNDLLKL